MLFNVHSDLATGEKDFFEMNPGARAIEAFNNLRSRQMFFVCLVADRDNDSPLRTQPERTRRERAVVICGYPMEGTRPDKNARDLINRKVESVEKAIIAYKDIQYDEERAMLDAINAQIQETLDAMGLDKREAARVVKIKTDKATGNTEKIEYVDAKQLSELRMAAIKLGVQLPSLRKSKAELISSIRSTSPAPLDNILTYSSQDVTDDVVGEEGGSTLDSFNEKRFKEQTQ